MDKQKAEQQLKEIKKTMKITEIAALRKAAWYYILQGSGWIITFTCAQLIPKYASYINMIVGILAVILFIIITFNIFKDMQKKVYIPKFNITIVLAIISFCLFCLSLIILFKLNLKQIILIAVLTIAFGNMLVGLFKHAIQYIFGLILLVNAFIAGMFFDKFFFLYIVDTTGIIFIIAGILFLLAGRKK